MLADEGGDGDVLRLALVDKAELCHGAEQSIILQLLGELVLKIVHSPSMGSAKGADNQADRTCSSKG